MEGIISIKNLQKNYNGFHLDIPEFIIGYGEIVGLIGENGAGKTTFLDILLNRRISDKGDINILGKANNEKDIKKKVGFIVDEGFLDGRLTGLKIDGFMKLIYDTWDTDYFFLLLREMAIPNNKEIRSLSKGMKRKLELCISLAYKPTLLIFDELTSGLDPAMRIKTLNLLKKYVEKSKATLLFSTHIMADITDIADKVCLIENGRIVLEASLEDLLNNYFIVKSDKKFEEKYENLIERKYYDLNWNYLIDRRYKTYFQDFEIEQPLLDKIILFFLEGVKRDVGTNKERFSIK